LSNVCEENAIKLSFCAKVFLYVENFLQDGEMNQTYQLAQINIARMKAPLDDPLMQDFVNGLEPINVLADDAYGFVWRMQTEEGDATSIQAFDELWIIVNMSVWESVASLREFTYKSAHVRFVRRRKEWFEKMDRPIFVMWWIPLGHLPTVEDAKERLAYLHENGDTAHAFTFKQVFEPRQ
jgi:hypothetical protein